MGRQEEFIFDVPPTINGAYEEFNRYLQEKRLMPSALFADNDMIALGAMQALQKNGYKIPEDISIVGFDGTSLCDVFSPQITTVRVFNREMGRLAVKRLIELIHDPEDTIKQRIQLCNEFLIRESTAPPAKGW